MKKIFKRNQIIITVLAIMIAVAGYINYISSMDNSDTKEANADVGQQTDEEMYDIYSDDIEIDDTSLMEP